MLPPLVVQKHVSVLSLSPGCEARLTCNAHHGPLELFIGFLNQLSSNYKCMRWLPARPA